MTSRLGNEGFDFVKRHSTYELKIFKKEAGNCRIIFSYSLNGRGNYAATGHLNVIYKDLSTILHNLIDNISISKNYDINNSLTMFAGVGINSCVGRSAKNSSTYRCASENEARQFSLNFCRQVKFEEENFVKPHLDAAVTIKEFMKPMHAFWPGDVKSFLEHLVAFGIKHEDKEMLNYAFQKADDVCKKLVPEARPLELIHALRQNTKNLRFMCEAIPM